MKKSQLFIKIFFCFFLVFASGNLLAKKAAIVIDYDTKKILFEVNSDTLNYPASLTKIMTLYIVFDYLHKNKLTWKTQLKVSKFAASEPASKLYLEEGTTISVEDAVMALIVKSANDVATVVAENISGSEKKFAKLMNVYALNLGMNKTTFRNAHGLPDKAQMTTVRDMAKLSHALITNFPKEYKLFSKEKFVWKNKNYKTHNRLMLSYNGADGIKTGYIRASGFQLAFSAVRDDKRLIGIYFGGDTGKQRNQRLAFLMNKSFKKLNINTNIKKEKKETVKTNKTKKNKYKIVVGTFKYKKNAEKHIKLIKKKYPKTTKNKESLAVVINNNGKQLYESRFQFFSIKDAKIACARLKKYKRDCFIRG